MSVCGTAVVGAAHCSELPLPVPCRNIFQKRSTMTGKNGFAKSGGSPRLFFSNSTLADNATYLAVCFGTTLFVVLNMAFALAFVEDLSRNANYFEDKNRSEGGNEKRGRHRRHRRDEEAEEEGRCRLHTSREYAFRNAACAELRAGDLRFLVARPCDRWLSRVPFAKKRPTRGPSKRAIATTHPQDDVCWERRIQGGVGSEPHRTGFECFFIQFALMISHTRELYSGIEWTIMCTYVDHPNNRSVVSTDWEKCLTLRNP